MGTGELMGAHKAPQILRISDLSKYNICTWSDDTIRRRVKDGLPAHKDAGGLYFLYDELMDYFRGNKVDPKKLLKRPRAK